MQKFLGKVYENRFVKKPLTQVIGRDFRWFVIVADPLIDFS
jgi:hypothetical protein